MNKKLLILILCLTGAIAHVTAQSRPKRVKQPREVLEAYRVCEEFRTLLAENLEFDRAFEATYVKDPARRRAIAIAGTELASGNLPQVDTDTLVAIYKGRVQLFLLMLPLMYANMQNMEAEDTPAVLLPPPIAAIFERKPPTDPQHVKAYADQLKRDVAEVRAHVESLATKNPDIAKQRVIHKDSLLTPLKLPSRIVKPLTAYSKRKVLPPAAKYYQVDDCAVVREGGQMRLIEYVFLKFRW